MWGGSGNDTFAYSALTDSTKGSAGRDTIRDFTHSEGDKIDFTALETTLGTDFHFHKNGLHGNEGDIAFFKGKVIVDTDGNGHADFAIKLAGVTHVVGGDFLL